MPSLRYRRIANVAWMAAILLACVPGTLLAAVPDFCFLHTSDNHFGPVPVGSPAPAPGKRASDGLTWFCQKAGKPQPIAPLNLTTPAPAFVIDTGDVTEYGAIYKTWDYFESAVKPLDIPFYISPGNHDNTWTSMFSIMRRRYGGDHYSFDRFGCHFACIDTASPQEPLPVIERRTLVWLAADLAHVSRETPVFLFCHHPLSTTEYVKPIEQLQLLQLIEGHNVVLMLMGHGHNHARQRWNSLDSVMGGTTSVPIANVGYNIVFVKGGVLRVVYRYRDPAKPMEVTLEKPVTPARGPRLTILSPAPDSRPEDNPPVAGDNLRFVVRIKQVRSDQTARITASIDDEAANRSSLARREADTFEGMVGTAGLLPGRHYGLVTADFGDSKIDREQEFLFAPPGSPSTTRVLLNAGAKARPLTVGTDVIVATTGGELVRVSFAGGKAAPPRTLYKTGVEILCPPVLADKRLYFSAAEKGVHCITLDGTLGWQCDVGAVVYGEPAVEGDRVYVADLEGNLHAINRATGQLAWSKHHATFSVEMPVSVRDGTIYFGAWDGFVYAANATDGSLKWRRPGPAGQTGKTALKSRYYAPADSPLVILPDRLVVCDRAYHLGSYNSATGKYLGEIATNVAAIGPTADGHGFYTRGLTAGLTRYDASGNVVWSDAQVPLGHFAIPPTEVSGRVYVCSDRGKLTVLDAASGKPVLQYQVTPRLKVMAPVAVDASGACYVMGMDGWVTRVPVPAR